MTPQKAIEILTFYRDEVTCTSEQNLDEALRMGIEALEEKLERDKEDKE